MSETFTAAVVREMIGTIRGLYEPCQECAFTQGAHEHTIGMLDAFAQRLERDEVIPLPTWSPPRTILDIEETWREEGRREVLRQIDDPVVLRRESEISGKHFECLFCHASNSTHRPDYKEVEHENDCLWLRAQQVTP